MTTKRIHTQGDIRQQTMDYCNAMAHGEWITGVVVNVDSVNVIISGTDILEPNQVVFFVGGGVIDDDFTVTVTITKNTTEVFNDTIDYHVVAP